MLGRGGPAGSWARAHMGSESVKASGSGAGLRFRSRPCGPWRRLQPRCFSNPIAGSDALLLRQPPNAAAIAPGRTSTPATGSRPAPEPRYARSVAGGGGWGLPSIGQHAPFFGLGVGGVRERVMRPGRWPCSLPGSGIQRGRGGRALPGARRNCRAGKSRGPRPGVGEGGARKVAAVGRFVRPAWVTFTDWFVPWRRLSVVLLPGV